MQPVRDVFEGYGDEAPDDRPLGAYAGLGALFSAEFALFLYAVRRTGRTLPERVEARDLLLLGVATHKIARIVTKEMITSPLRAPFTRYQKPAGAGEINESTRGTGLRHALGELLTCPFCFAVWVASYLTYGFVFAPRVTRLIAGIFGMVTLSDTLQDLYDLLKNKAEHPDE
ncbi:MAG: DUF1360 domain-containing protein [Chloroflexota bacterium]|nr:DUF1360 domain-containing protein [Chloroflexota bacterium]